MRDSHIIYPEWNGVGNNNGILASQLPYSGNSDDIHFERVRIDGNIVALTNLKRNEAQEKTIPSGRSPGGIRNVTFTNIVVTGTQLTYNYDRSQETASRSGIRGDDQFTVSDVHFENLRIGGVNITEDNRSQFFEIDQTTTSGITFSAAPLLPPSPLVVNSVSILNEEFISMSFNGDYGRRYRVEKSIDLSVWTAFGPPLIGFDEEVFVTHSNDSGSVFFRIVKETE